MSKSEVFGPKRQLDGENDGLGRKRKTQCKYGHPFDGTEKWSINWKGYKCRICRECGRVRMQRKRDNPDFKANEAAKMRRWREKHPEWARIVQKRSYVKRDAWLRSFKTQCKFCGEKRYPCLDFHHRDSDAKRAAIGEIRHWSRERLAEEIEKCDIVCANCHRFHHWKENKALAHREQQKSDGHLSETAEGLQSSADRAVGDV